VKSAPPPQIATPADDSRRQQTSNQYLRQGDELVTGSTGDVAFVSHAAGLGFPRHGVHTLWIPALFAVAFDGVPRGLSKPSPTGPAVSIGSSTTGIQTLTPPSRLRHCAPRFGYESPQFCLILFCFCFAGDKAEKSGFSTRERNQNQNGGGYKPSLRLRTECEKYSQHRTTRNVSRNLRTVHRVGNRYTAT
jgi:hypothetical protein